MSARRDGRASCAKAAVRAIALAAGLAVIAPLLVGSPASAYWSVESSGTSIASAATVKPGSTPTASVANKNAVTVSWPATTLSNGVSVTGYTVSRYNSSSVLQTTLAGCSGTVTSTSCTETGLPDGRWTYRVTPRLQQNWVGAQGAVSNQVLTDATAPVNNISLVPAANVFLGGSTVWVRTSAGAGSFRLSNALTDVTSGPASSASSLPTAGAGFSHTPGTVSTPVGGPYVSAPYSWTLNATGTPTARITGRDNLANTAAADIAIRPDNTAPTGGAISYPDGQRVNRDITIDTASIADGQSGATAGSRRIQYSQADSNGATCSAFGGWVTFITNPSPSEDVIVGDGCSRFRYVFTDNVGNQTISASSATVIMRSSYDTTVLATPGNLSFWRLDGTTSTILDSGVAVNNGTWFNNPTLGQPGAIAADSNTSVLFDGVNDYGSVTRQIQDDFSIEFWFKSVQGEGNSLDWYDGAGLVDAQFGYDDFGVSLMADGRVMAGTGDPDTSLASPAGKNDGSWHHVVFTRAQATGAVRLYVDGVQVSSGTGGTQALNASANIAFGRAMDGGHLYKGNLDEIALYNVALPASTVLDHYNVAKLP